FTQGTHTHTHTHTQRDDFIVILCACLLRCVRANVTAITPTLSETSSVFKVTLLTFPTHTHTHTHTHTQIQTHGTRSLPRFTQSSLLKNLNVAIKPPSGFWDFKRPFPEGLPKQCRSPPPRTRLGRGGAGNMDDDA